MKQILILFFCLLCGLTASALVLTPAPKILDAPGIEVSFGYDWQIIGSENFAEPAAWLQEELAARHWTISGDGRYAVTMMQVEDNGNSEFYTLEINADGVVLGAGTQEGMFRAVGRFLALLKQPFSIHSSEGFTTQALSIADWPDTPVRSMTLTMCYWEPFSNEERIDSTKKIIEIMAEHGFNYVFLTMGSNYVSKYFKSQRPFPWSEAEVREMVRFANSRGVRALPYTQFVSHIGTGPQICFYKDASGNAIGHDIMGEEFYQVMPLVIDELLDWFDNPPYFRVGGDEANAFFSALNNTPERNAELFAKSFNFLAEHLATRNCRAVMWHDMLFAGELGGHREELGGVAEGKVVPSEYALSLMNKDIIMNYWHYGVDDEYYAARILQDAGFEVWASTWYFTDGIFCLGNAVGTMGMSAYDGTTWCNNHTKGAETVLVGELAWNTQIQEIAFDPDEVFMREYSGSPYFPAAADAEALVFENAVDMPGYSGININVGNLQINSAPVAAARTVFSTLDVPELIVKMKEERPDTELFLSGSGERFVLRPTGINCFRDHNTLILYTPSHGKSTGQNMWGDDWRVVDGQVISATLRVPDAQIPENGCVISAHTTGGELHNNTRKIMKKGFVDFIISQREEPGELPLLTAKCSEGTETVVLVFASELYPYCDTPDAAAIITVKTVDGAEEQFNLNADFALYPDPNFFGNFKVIYLPEGRVAISWESAGKNISDVNVQFTATGTSIGTVLLGAVEM